MRASSGRQVGDSETIRRQNRALLLAALREQGPMPRTQLAGATGLSHASITAITQDMLNQGVLVDVAGNPEGQKGRGRPAVKIGLNRDLATVCLVEIGVGHARFSLVDYGGVLDDRIEFPIAPHSRAAADPLDFIAASIATLRQRNLQQFGQLRRIAIAVQGILDKTGNGLLWSPMPNLAGRDIVSVLSEEFKVPVAVIKRGSLLAEGTRQLNSDLRNASIATVFIGSTIAMGLSAPEGNAAPRELATEFGHMNHIPDGALCRCGMRGCIEAYAADYGILRTAYSVPEATAPAPVVPASEFEKLIGRARSGDRSATHAFNLAGRAIGYGLSRVLALHEPSHIVIVGPGTHAFGLMKGELQAALSACLVGRVRGLPELRTLPDESEPIFRGLVSRTLKELDQSEIAALAPIAATA